MDLAARDYQPQAPAKAVVTLRGGESDGHVFGDEHGDGCWYLADQFCLSVARAACRKLAQSWRLHGVVRHVISRQEWFGMRGGEQATRTRKRQGQ